MTKIQLSQPIPPPSVKRLEYGSDGLEIEMEDGTVTRLTGRTLSNVWVTRDGCDWDTEFRVNIDIVLPQAEVLQIFGTKRSVP
ncbi:MAG TPA: hypothetical protein VM450_00515 [Thermomicrobiales bacterium]|jgi:hypothetical protein|nr:hypothetical protein [Thermomicrobiales bacterium]